MVLLCHLLCRAEMCVRVSCDLVKVQQTTQSPPSHPLQIAEHNYCAGVRHVLILSKCSQSDLLLVSSSAQLCYQLTYVGH